MNRKRNNAFNLKITGLSTWWFPVSPAGPGFKCTEHKDKFSKSLSLLLWSSPASKSCQVTLFSKCNFLKKCFQTLRNKIMQDFIKPTFDQKCTWVQNNAYPKCLKTDESRIICAIFQRLRRLNRRTFHYSCIIKEQKTHLNCYCRFAAAHTLDNEKANTEPILSLFPEVILQERDHGFHLAFYLPHPELCCRVDR